MSVFAGSRRSCTRSVLSLGKQLRMPKQRLFSSISSESVLFPDEKEGNDYATNWAVASCGVSVSGSAFRNLDQKVMKKFKKTLEMSGEKNSEYFGGVDADTFADIASDTRATLSTSENLFLSDIEGGVRVRAVTDDVAFANTVQQLLPITNVEAQNFNAVVSLVHSSVADSEAPGPYVAVGNGIVVARGSVPAELIKKGLTQAAEAKVGAEVTL